LALGGFAACGPPVVSTLGPCPLQPQPYRPFWRCCGRS
jgi:hypothetical protein